MTSSHISPYLPISPRHRRHDLEPRQDHGRRRRGGRLHRGRDPRAARRDPAHARRRRLSRFLSLVARSMHQSRRDRTGAAVSHDLLVALDRVGDFVAFRALANTTNATAARALRTRASLARRGMRPRRDRPRSSEVTDSYLTPASKKQTQNAIGPNCLPTISPAASPIGRWRSGPRTDGPPSGVRLFSPRPTGVARAANSSPCRVSLEERAGRSDPR